jgi:hypothetical protein
MASFFLCVGDQLPLIAEQLVNGDGTFPNLTGATVAFTVRDLTHASAVFGGAATVLDPIAATVQYTWQVSDTTAAGTYIYRWIVTFPGGKQESFPNGDTPRQLLISSRL